MRRAGAPYKAAAAARHRRSWKPGAIAEPGTGRSDDAARHYPSFWFAFRRLFLARRRSGRVQNLQVRRVGCLSDRGEISGERDGRGAGAARAGGELRDAQRSRNRARAPHSGMHLPIDRMPAHLCPLSAPLQASCARWRAGLAAIKGSILAYVPSCTRCCAARRAPSRLSGARSRTDGTIGGTPVGPPQVGSGRVACRSSGAAVAMRDRRVCVMNCLGVAWLAQQSLTRSPNFT